MKKPLEILAHIFFWLIFTAFVVIMTQIFLQAKPDPVIAQRSGYLVFVEVAMALILFYTTFFGIPPARKSTRNIIILSAILLLQLAFFAWPATRHGKWEVMSSLIPHIIVIFLAVVFRKFSDSVRLEKEKQDLLLQNTQSELALLKMQVSPHFLFNTLNNIDYLISNDVTKASDCISRLGDILRYMIYDAKAEKIPLAREIKHIEDYIALIRLRTSGSDFISYRRGGAAGYLQIAPMLFIPLIENAYKHCSKKEGENIIVIETGIDGNNIVFRVSNEYEDSPDHKTQANEGIGLNLVRRRLELIYPSKNSFSISPDKKRFNVELTIELDEY